MPDTKKILQSSFGLLILFAVIFLFVRTVVKNVRPEDIRQVRIAGEILRVDLALTPEVQTEGLSGRLGLPEGEGMLFVFPSSGQYDFWMQGMTFPIDIIWIDEEKEIIYIKKNALPEDPFQTFGPEEKSKYVLETVAGFSEKYNLQVGDKVEFTR